MGLQIGQGITITGAVDIQFEFPSPPVNTTIPVVTGNLNNGNTLSTSNGTWTGIPYDFVYTYQWQRDSSNVSGATSNTYVLSAADIGYPIRSTVTATTPVGSAFAYSLQTSPILPALPNAPTNVVPTSYNSTTGSVSWTPPSYDGGGAIISYNITAICLNGKSPSSLTVNVPGPTSGLITGLATGGLYEFYVAAVNAAGAGPSAQGIESIYILPAIGEFYQGGYVIAANQATATVTAPVAGPSGGTGNWATCLTYCNNLISGGYSDWTMPSLTNLNLGARGPTAGTYWSSTQQVGAFPIRYYTQTFPGGVNSVNDATDAFLKVRAIRTATYP